MRVLCTKPNASELISGVKFEKTPDGMLSEEISDDIAKRFLSIPGYVLPKEDQPEDQRESQPKRRGRPPKTEFTD